MVTGYFPSGSRVLVTGVNGYIASHIADRLLNMGYVVRGTARDQNKVKQIQDLLLARNPDAKFEGVAIPDLADGEELVKAFKGVDGIIHTAADVSLSPDPNQVIPHSVEDVKTLLRAASAVPTIKRVVLTSSSIAAVKPTANKVGKVDETSWNETDFQNAWAPPPYTADRAFPVYAAGKLATEKAAWEYMKEHKPHFSFAAVLPDMTTGPILGSFQAGSTGGWIRGLFEGDEKWTQWMLNFPPQWFVDVRDVAAVHIGALIEPDAAGKRFFAFAQTFNYSRIRDILLTIDPDRKLPDAPANEGHDLFDVLNGPAEELVKTLASGRRGWRPLEESLGDQFAYQREQSASVVA